jgi:hypothetical protein
MRDYTNLGLLESTKILYIDSVVGALFIHVILSQSLIKVQTYSHSAIPFFAPDLQTIEL